MHLRVFMVAYRYAIRVTLKCTMAFIPYASIAGYLY